MRGRYPGGAAVSYSFGPGPLTPAIKMIIGANVALFVIDWVLQGALMRPLAFSPETVLEQLQLWRVVTYMFLHGGLFHILFNMLALWMFGVELERMWGSRFFVKYYFVTGIGAVATTTVLSFIPGLFGGQLYSTPTVGASGAIYGVLLAYALYFPHRPILISLLFPVPARYAVMIFAGISLMASMSGPGGIAHTTHLGGMAVGYLYLKGGRIHLLSEVQYRFLKWRINRIRRKFDVHPGGRANDVDRRVH